MPELCAIVCVAWWWTVKSVEGFATVPQRTHPKTVSAPAIAIVAVTVPSICIREQITEGVEQPFVPAIDRTNARRTARRAPSISGHRVSIFIAGEQPGLANAVWPGAPQFILRPLRSRTVRIVWTAMPVESPQDLRAGGH